jgi:hypothetical protein
MSAAPAPWPALDYAATRPTIDHLHRLAHIAGKYTLDMPFELGWGNTVLAVTPRGLSSPVLAAGGAYFTVDYELLDDRVAITSSRGRASLPLEPGTVAGFVARFERAAAGLGIPPLRSYSQPEIPGAPPLDEDTEERPYDPAVARIVWSALAGSTAALVEWQAPFRGHRPRVGLMWGGFDISATRYNGRSATPPPDRPAFLQNSMLGEVVAVGFAFGDPIHGPDPGFYGYIGPPPDGLDSFDFGAAEWRPSVGLVALPWDAVRTSRDPTATVIAFADAVYDAAVQLGGWPDDLLGPRCDGWHAARHLLS